MNANIRVCLPKKKKKKFSMFVRVMCVCVWCLDMEFWKEKNFFHFKILYFQNRNINFSLSHTHTQNIFSWCPPFIIIIVIIIRQDKPSIHPIWAPTFYLLVREKPEKKKISNQIIMVDWYSQNQVCISFFFIYRFTVVQKKKRA